jgi:transcriptional regulator with PAS, ATPase and Fis domain
MPKPPTARFLTESLKLVKGDESRVKAEHHIASVLLRHAGNVSGAAQEMGVGRATLNRWIASNAYVAKSLDSARKWGPA